MFGSAGRPHEHGYLLRGSSEGEELGEVEGFLGPRDSGQS